MRPLHHQYPLHLATFTSENNKPWAIMVYYTINNKPGKIHSCFSFFFPFFLERNHYITPKNIYIRGQSVFHTTSGPIFWCSHGRSLFIARPIIAIAAMLGNRPSSSSDGRPGFVACLPWPGPSWKTGVPPWHHLPIQLFTLFAGIGVLSGFSCVFSTLSKLWSSITQSVVPVSVLLQGSAMSNERFLCLSGGLPPTFGLLEPGMSGSGMSGCRRLSHLSLGSAPIGGWILPMEIWFLILLIWESIRSRFVIPVPGMHDCLLPIVALDQTSWPSLTLWNPSSLPYPESPLLDGATSCSLFASSVQP